MNERSGNSGDHLHDDRDHARVRARQDWQLRITDIVPDILPPPPLWECMNTCAHAGEVTDFFPGTTRKRCKYGMMRDGCSGRDLYEKVRDNIVKVYCKYYEEGGT